MIKKVAPIAVMSLALLLPFSLFGQSTTGEERRAEVIKPTHADKSQRPLRDIVDAPNAAVPREGKDFEPGRPQAVGNLNNSKIVDPLAARGIGATTANPEPKAGTVGVPVDPNYAVAPPDTTGDLGPNHYVQWVNLRYSIYTLTRDATTKAIQSFDLVPGFPKNGNAVFAGMNSRCATTNDGDPIVQYDQAADRWVLTQFVAGAAPYLQCVAVSTTPDPTGTYNRYEYSYGADFNDYGKMGVWSDSYVMTYNMFRRGRTFVGAKVCAFDRAKMIVGDPTASQICAQTSSSYFSLMPADIEGTTQPAAGTAMPLLSITSSSLLSWKYAVNFSTGTGTLSGPTTVPGVAAFSRACGGGTCIPQPGTTNQLDSLGDRLMYRLSYRNFGDHEMLLVNHSVAASGATGVRWYELRNAANNTISSATPVVFQQGTYAPDSNYRWMGSAAMDKTGAIAIGYNISNGSTIKPSIRYAFRAVGDTLGALGGETGILSGPGSQAATLARWGDYSTMSVDPVDGCTMVFTTEFLPADGKFNWSTYIYSFKLSTCQ